MKILASVLLCLCSLIIFAQQDSPSGENTSIKKNGFLSSLVVDEGGLPLIVDIDITDNATNKIVQQFQSSRIGYSRISLPSGNYNIVFSKQGYLFHSENFIIQDSAGYEKKLKKVILKKVEVGNNTVLKNIAFEDNQSVLKEASFNDLQRVLELMNEIVTIQIEISGEIGSDAQVKTNKELAEQRAKVLIDYLVSKGVDRKRLKYSNNVDLPIELVDNEVSETVDSKVQVKIVDMGPQKIVQTGGQYYAVPETSTKKSRKNKKNKATEENNETVAKSTESAGTDKVAESGALKETPKEDVVVVAEKQDEKPAEEATAVTTPVDIGTKEEVKTETAELVKENVEIATLEKKEEPVETQETKKEESKSNEGLNDTKARESEPVAAEAKQPEINTEEASVVAKDEIKKQPVENSALSASDLEEEKKAEKPVAANDSAQVTIRNLGSAINSPFADYAPLISADGTKLVFSTQRPLNASVTALPAKKGKAKVKAPEIKSSIYSSSYEQNTEHWLMAMPLKQGINIENLNNTAIALSNDNKKMLLYRSADNTNTAGDIMETTSPNGVWTVPTMLLSAVNGPAVESAASYSPDSRTVYFVSNRPGGAGMKDIWFCTQNEKGEWGDATNIGSPVNTDKDEESVFLHPNGSTLFFSSKGHNTIGGYDIFMSEYNDLSKTWEKPRNLGSYINTSEDDLYFVLAADGKTGYYSADRTGGMGKEDIYQVLLKQSMLEKNITLVKGIVKNETDQVLRARITIKDKDADKLIGSYTSSAGTGEYQVPLPEGKSYEIKVMAPDHLTYIETIDLTDKRQYEQLEKNIALEAKNAFLISRVYDEAGRPIDKALIEFFDKNTKQLIEKTESDSYGYSKIALPSNRSLYVIYTKPGYLFQQLGVSTPNVEPGKEYEKDLKTIVLQKMEEGKKTVLSNVSFDPNQPTLRPESFLDLERVIKMLSNMPSLHVEVSDHLHNSATRKMIKLSKKRAKVIADSLISMGADKKRVQYKSYGPWQPIAPNRTEEGREMNRRVELKIIKIDAETELQAEEKRWKEEQLVAEQNEGSTPFDNESTLEKKDSTISVVEKEEPVKKKQPATEIVTSEEPVKTQKETIDIVSQPEETKAVATEESAQNKKEEQAVGVMPGLDNVVGEEPVTANNETTDIVSSPKETKTVTTEEPVQNKKEELEAGVMPGMDGVVSEEPAQSKNETTEIVSSPEETKTVTTEEPVPNKKEALEAGVMPGMDGIVSEEPANESAAIGLETKNAIITSKVYDETGRPVNKVQIEVIDKETQQVIERTESDSLGYSRIALPSNRTIGLTYKKTGYLFQSVIITLPELEPGKEYEKDLGTITFQKIKKDNKTVLSNISFDSNEAILKEEQSLPDLENVVRMLNNMSSLQVEVSDHIDKTDVSKKMKKLSQERAKAVADRLISMGADKKRIRYKSYGASQPIASDGMQPDQAMNRRVELKILKIDTEAEYQAEEKRRKEEQPVVAENESNNSVSNESMLEKKDSTISTIIETKKETIEIVSSPEETKTVTTDEPVQNKKEEPEVGVMPGLEGVVSEEPAQTKNETIEIVSSPEETKTVATEEPAQNKKEEPEAGVMPGLDGVVSEEPAQTKSETIEIVSSPEETKAVTTEEPAQNKKEEPEVGVMPGLDGVVSEESPSTKEAKKEPVPKVSLPERFVKFDSDKDGIISPAEINGAIDSFFDDNSTIVADDINAMIDYFFDN